MPGTLVNRDQLTDGTSVTAGKVVIGLSLKPGQLPTSTLKAGDQVLVIATEALSPSEAGTSPRADVLVPRATVFGVDGSSRNGDTTEASIAVDEADASSVAAAASAGQIALGLVAP
ncbi:MAG: hypothetical protein JO265_04490 [Acidimicrobiia bacterium]|nr:hypothetical protein [Acidimicrobiia bacterium]